jgi:hypothetical protein
MTPIRVDLDQSGSASFCVGDRISGDGLEFRPREDSSFYANYQLFAGSIKLATRDPQQEAEIRDATRSLVHEAHKLTMLQKEQEKAWVEFDIRQKAAKNRSQWINYENWYVLSRYAPAVLQQKAAVNTSQQALAKLADPRITQAIQDIELAHDPSYQTTVIGKDGTSRL